MASLSIGRGGLWLLGAEFATKTSSRRDILEQPPPTSMPVGQETEEFLRHPSVPLAAVVLAVALAVAADALPPLHPIRKAKSLG
mmetsp:Transcript_27999/g.80289  ORF Transcript_27999/g.80289 Transcript_27999/m.80289 type:complete len:84 (-) Transcript_27999:286-537(-)